MSDHPDNSMTKVLLQRENMNNTSNINTHVGDAKGGPNPSEMVTTKAPSSLNISNTNSSQAIKHPILYNQTQPDANETVMIDDVMSSIYSNNHHKNNATFTVTSNLGTNRHSKSIDSINVASNSEANVNRSCKLEKMRQELCTEDIYTLRFASQSGLEPPLQFDSTGPKEQQSFLYNGSLNRPAFEIISHADVRPATPIQFEQVKELNPTGFAHTADYHRRSNTSPVRLNYGNQMSVKQSGQPVEWQVASEVLILIFMLLKTNFFRAHFDLLT